MIGFFFGFDLNTENNYLSIVYNLEFCFYNEMKDGIMSPCQKLKKFLGMAIFLVYEQT